MLTLEHPSALSNKILAIKALRQLNGMGLKEAKDAIEAIVVNRPKSFRSDYDVLGPQLDEIASSFRNAGFKVDIVKENNTARKALGEEIQKLITYATLSGQYDIARSLLDVADAYCIEPDETFDLEKAIRVAE